MSNVLGSINHFFAKIGSWLQSPLLLALRLFFGISFILAGFGKLQDINSFINNVRSLNIPYPEITGWIAALSEFIGGSLLTVGLLSRIAALFLASTMLVAYATAHFDAVSTFFTNPGAIVAEQPFNFLLTALLVLAFGPGFFSLDHLLADRE